MIAGSFGAHTTRLATLVTKKTIQERPSTLSRTVLLEKWT
jgi:hypothetical protein